MAVLPVVAHIELLNEQNKEVAKEVQNIMISFENENVKGNRDNRLDIWCIIFSRLLRLDGKRMLCSHSGMRFNAKQRANDALDYPNHPIIDLATKIINFLERVEYWGLKAEDIVDEQL